MFESVEGGDQAVDEHDPDTIVVAHAAPQRNKAARTIPIDNPAELQNSTLGEWDTRYLELMDEAHEERAKKISVAQAKRNATYWILDQGIGGVSADFREDNEEHALSIFSGEALLEMLAYPETQVAGRKRSSSAIAEESRDRRVRPRSQEDPAIDDRDDFQPGGMDEEQPNDEEDIPEPEMGREQEVPLSNGPEKYPWNEYASSHRGSRQGSVHPPMSIAGISSSAGRPPHIDFVPSSLGSKRISRMIQESPLNRRRLLHHSSLAGSGHADTEADITFGEDDFGLGLDLDETIELDEQLDDDLYDADFETYGPAAPALVSTQQAADSQWLAETLEQEAYNFLTFLSATVEGKKADEEQETVVTFEELLPPNKNSHVVAAQGLLHVLSLATKGLIEVLQQDPFGRIEMGIAEVVARSDVEAV